MYSQTWNSVVSAFLSASVALTLLGGAILSGCGTQTGDSRSLASGGSPGIGGSPGSGASQGERCAVAVTGCSSAIQNGVELRGLKCGTVASGTMNGIEFCVNSRTCSSNPLQPQLSQCLEDATTTSCFAECVPDGGTADPNGSRCALMIDTACSRFVECRLSIAGAVVTPSLCEQRRADAIENCSTANLVPVSTLPDTEIASCVQELAATTCATLCNAEELRACEPNLLAPFGLLLWHLGHRYGKTGCVP